MCHASASGRAALALTLLAAAYGVGLLLWAAVVPSTGGGETLLEYGGPASLAILAQPLLASGAVWLLLRRQAVGASPHAVAGARILALAFLAWSVIGALSLAAGAFPAAAILVVAAWLAPSFGTRSPSGGPDTAGGGQVARRGAG